MSVDTEKPLVLGGQGLKLIKHFEMFVPTVYICPAGWPTIGYGHAIFDKDEEELWRKREPISEEDAEALLVLDTEIAAKAVRKYISAPLEQHQFDALVSFTFNLGGGNLQRSTLRMKLNREDYASVRPELMKWTRSGGRVLKGLIRRRAAEADLFEQGLVML